MSSGSDRPPRCFQGEPAESFKPGFAVLYTAWTKFNALFLASSLLSTELWYAFTGKGSLAPTKLQLRAA